MDSTGKHSSEISVHIDSWLFQKWPNSAFHIDPPSGSGEVTNGDVLLTCSQALSENIYEWGIERGVEKNSVVLTCCCHSSCWVAVVLLLFIFIAEIRIRSSTSLLSLCTDKVCSWLKLLVRTTSAHLIRSPHLLFLWLPYSEAQRQGVSVLPSASVCGQNMHHQQYGASSEKAYDIRRCCRLASCTSMMWISRSAPSQGPWVDWDLVTVEFAGVSQTKTRPILVSLCEL